MRVIPPKQYTGTLPEGYSLKDFFRFDQVSGETYGVLYSGEKVNVNHVEDKPRLTCGAGVRCFLVRSKS